MLRSFRTFRKIVPIPLLCLLMAISLVPAYSQSGNWNIKDEKLTNNWMIHSVELLQEGGHQISTATFQPNGWYPVEVPTTVLAALVKNKAYKEIYTDDDQDEIPANKDLHFDRNLTKIPLYKFNVPWWYRTTFTLPKESARQIVRLQFDGINYRADIWLNGHKIASADTLNGSFRQFSLGVTPYVKSGVNVLAVEVSRPWPGDLAPGFADWNPVPPDHNMGLWRPVHLLISGPVTIAQPFVQTRVDTATLDDADLTISTVVYNYSPNPVQGKLTGFITEHRSNIRFSKNIMLKAGGAREIVFTPAQFHQLSMDHPKFWWVHDLGKPNLYSLHLKFTIDNKLSDDKTIHFGIRTISDYINKEGFRGFKINGKKVLIKGGGFTDLMLLNASHDYEKAEIDYAVQMNLNAIRMEGFWGEDPYIYNLCDEKGILIQVGYSAQWEHANTFGAPVDEYGGMSTLKQMDMAVKSFRDQITWLRNHPSIFVWMYGSDKWPRPSLEKRYLSVLKQYDPTRPALSSAGEDTSTITGYSAIKMRGPYDYVPPDYWYIDTLYGGAFGYNTETSPGPEVPVAESMKKFIPADSLWPISSSWIYHTAGDDYGGFHNLTRYNHAMDERLGKPLNFDDYERKAQYLNYEGMRAMYEAFEANRFKSTGIIQWMYNSAWPKLWWQLFDYYLMPTGAFYGARKANEPSHISYNYGKDAVDVMNNTLKNEKGLLAQISIYDFNLKQLLYKNIPVSILPGQKTEQIFLLPEKPSLSITWFLDLKLYDSQHQLISSNFYALSKVKDKLEETKSTWFVTPESQFADLKMLQQLPDVRLDIQKSFKKKEDTTFTIVKIKNPTDHLAFMIHLDLRKKENGQSVLPVFWDENYITLLPGEERIVRGYCHTQDLDGQQPEVTIDGWNILSSH